MTETQPAVCPKCGELGIPVTLERDKSVGYYHDTTWPGEPCRSHRWCWIALPWLTERLAKAGKAA